MVTDETMEEPSADSTLTQEATEKPSPIDEEEFQKWWGANEDVVAWRKQFVKEYGEEPNPDDATYDYRKAWKSGVTPKPNPQHKTKSGEDAYHWGSRAEDGSDLKSKDHPTRWKSDYMEMFGIDPDTSGISEEDALKEIKVKQIETPSELDVSEIDAEFMDKNEEEASEHIRNKYGEYGFEVEQISVGDAMKLTARDEKGNIRKDKDGNDISIEVDLQAFTEGGRKEEAEKLKGFLKNNASSQPLDTSLKTLADIANRRGKYETYNQEEVDRALKMRYDKVKIEQKAKERAQSWNCLLYTSPSPRDRQKSRMPSSA